MAKSVLNHNQEQPAKQQGVVLRWVKTEIETRGEIFKILYPVQKDIP